MLPQLPGSLARHTLAVAYHTGSELAAHRGFAGLGKASVAALHRDFVEAEAAHHRDSVGAGAAHRDFVEAGAVRKGSVEAGVAHRDFVARHMDSGDCSHSRN